MKQRTDIILRMQIGIFIIILIIFKLLLIILAITLIDSLINEGEKCNLKEIMKNNVENYKMFCDNNIDFRDKENDK